MAPGWLMDASSYNKIGTRMAPIGLRTISMVVSDFDYDRKRALHPLFASTLSLLFVFAIFGLPYPGHPPILASFGSPHPGLVATVPTDGHGANSVLPK